MSPVELTAVAAIIISATTSILIPWILRRRAAHRASSDTNIVSWQSITAVLQKERDALQARLDNDQGSTRRILRELDNDYATQMITARRRITELEEIVARLSTRLRRYEDPITGDPTSDSDPPEPQ